MQWTSQLINFLTMNPSNKVHLVLLYRYISLALTTGFFLFAPPQAPLFFKMGVVISLVIATWILTDLQKRYRGSSKVLRSIILTETIGLTLLLIPTGGIESPFIWYAFNPVLTAASLLTPVFCWVILTFYLSSATLIAHLLYRPDQLMETFINNSYIYLVCLLTTSLVMLFSGLTKELDEKAAALNSQQEQLLVMNRKLSTANEMYKTTLEHIMSIYHLMDHFSVKKRPDSLTLEITNALIKCTQKQAAFFWLMDVKTHTIYLENKTGYSHLSDHLDKVWQDIQYEKNPFYTIIEEKHYWIKTIKTSAYIGVQGIQINGIEEVENTFLLKRTFEFIAELGEFMLEKLYIDEIMDQLIITEEQNRIANEIHDNVSQKLFSMVYFLHNLQKKSQTISKEELNEEFRFLAGVANSTLKELRAAIYRLSSIKKEEKSFLTQVRNYLEEYAKLNDITIHYQIVGDESYISSSIKPDLFRMIYEGCSNAVRHGKCTTIDIQFTLAKGKIGIAICDDGIGFTASQQQRQEKGIGLINMQHIAQSFGGSFSIKNREKKGTAIHIVLPHHSVQEKSEVHIL